MATAKDAMEEGLLLKERDDKLSWRVLVEEMKKLGFVAGPMVAVTMSQYLLQVISVMMVGHLGELSLSSTSIAISLSSVTGFSLIFGAFACFDFAASGPYVEIDMRSGAVDGYDAITLSPHKFLVGPGSPGVLLMSKALYHFVIEN